MHRRKLRGTREASNGGRVRVRIIHGLNISHKNSHTYCKNLQLIKTKYYTHAPTGRVGRSKPSHDPDLHTKDDNQ